MPVTKRRNRLLAMIALGVVAAALTATPAQAGDTKEITIHGDECESGVPTHATLTLTNVDEHTAPHLDIGVNTKQWLQAQFDSFSDGTATYTVANLDAPVKNGMAVVHNHWDGEFSLEVSCEESQEPDVTVSCDFDGVDPKVLNVKVTNSNSVSVIYTITATETEGPTNGRNLSRFAEQSLSVPPGSTEEADFGPIDDSSSFRVTVEGKDGTHVTEKITCGIMPGAWTGSADPKPDKGGEAKPDPTAIKTSPAAESTPSTAPEPVGIEAEETLGNRKPKPASNDSDTMALAGRIAVIILLAAVLLFGFLIAIKKGRQEHKSGSDAWS